MNKFYLRFLRFFWRLMRMNTFLIQRFFFTFLIFWIFFWRLIMLWYFLRLLMRFYGLLLNRRLSRFSWWFILFIILLIIADTIWFNRLWLIRVFWFSLLNLFDWLINLWNNNWWQFNWILFITIFSTYMTFILMIGILFISFNLTLFLWEFTFILDFLVLFTLLIFVLNLLLKIISIHIILLNRANFRSSFFTLCFYDNILCRLVLFLNNNWIMLFLRQYFILI